MSRKLPFLLALIFALPLVAQQPATPDAQDIMARVAANQDATEAARLHYVYVQHAHVRSLKGHTVRCEETTDTRITPTANGSDQQLLKLDGRLLLKGKYITYNALPKPRDTNVHDTTKADRDEDINVTINNEDDTDRDIVENMRGNLTNDKSKDGIGARLFPLTSKSQTGYDFQLLGHAPLNGHDTFHLIFHPKDTSDTSDYGWKGDAYIDTTTYQPVLVRTAMARNIPFAVRTLLGTSLPGLGFSVTYAPQPDGVWFPITFGTEFKMHILFFFNREIIIDAHNLDFEKTHVTSTIHSEDPPEPTKP